MTPKILHVLQLFIYQTLLSKAVMFHSPTSFFSHVTLLFLLLLAILPEDTSCFLSLLQKQACMLLRNMVARMQKLTQPILEMGAEPLISQALATHQEIGRAHV